MIQYNNNRIIAIGDIHGDYYILIHTLLKANVIYFKEIRYSNNYKSQSPNKSINNNSQIYKKETYEISNILWCGNDTYVVQIGDILDGKRPNTLIEKDYYNEPMEIKIQNFILYIDYLARLKGGRFISILGNHDIYPYLYYNDAKYEKDFVKKTDSREYYKLYKKTRFKYYFPGNEGAKLLSKRPLLLKLGKYLFCHGTITKEFLELYSYNLPEINQSPSNNNNKNHKKVNIDKINEEISQWLRTGNKRPKFFELQEDKNPLFSKLLTKPEYMNEEDCNKYVNKILEYFDDVEFIVMGHSIHKKINLICDCVYQIDISLSRAFGGNLKSKIDNINFLEIKN